MNVPSAQTTFQLHHNLATNRYAWFLAERVNASEWWQASEWFESVEEAHQWSSADYLRRRSAHVDQLLSSLR